LDHSKAERLDHHRQLIRLVEAHPENRSGADKTWVELAMREYQEHYRKASRG
jgi:hypothetical protein